ncbi:MAG TPA: hypothetical protein VKG23_13865, partial [Thermoanaerobaculia bacterium]|nr:hypothetical protein [Thermoanaerobaculia bacterium]
MAGQEPIDFDASSIAALFAAGPAGTYVTIDDFPVQPGASGRAVLRRFEVVAPAARIEVTGPRGDLSVPMPPVAHFRGHIEGERGSIVYLAAQQDKVVAYVQTSGGRSYVGPDESNLQYVLRTVDSPLNERAATSEWRCQTEDLPEAPVSVAPRVWSEGLGSIPPDVTSNGYKKAEVDVETDNQLYTSFGGDVNALGAYVATLFGADDVIYDNELALHLTVNLIHTWSVPDPYVGPAASDQLNQLG